MTWAKIDDTLHSHRKRRAAGFEALGLWVVAMSYCAHHLSDGMISDDDVVELCRGDKKLAGRLAARLVEAGLWDQSACGQYRFHDWHHYQPTRASVLEQRARKADAGRRGGLASAQARAQAPASTTQVEHVPKHPANQIPPGRSRPVDPAQSTRLREVPESDPTPVAEAAAKFAELAKKARGGSDS